MKSFDLEIRKTSFLNFSIALFFSIFIVSIPWLALNNGYKDLDVFRYIDYLESGYIDYQYKYNFNSLKDYIFNEWLWLKLQLTLNYLGLSASSIFLYIIPFLNIFFLSLFLLKFIQPKYLVFTFYSGFLMFYTNQIRLALALAVFLYFFFVFFKNNIYKSFVVISVSLIHASMVMFLTVFFVVYKICFLKIAEYHKIFIIFLLSFFFVLLNSDFLSLILSALGSDRGEYYKNFSLPFSLFSTMYFFLMCLVLIYTVLFRKLKFTYFQLLSIFTYFTIFLCFFFENSYPSRYLALFFPFLIISIYQTKSVVYYLLFLVLTIYSFYFDLNLSKFLVNIF